MSRCRPGSRLQGILRLLEEQPEAPKAAPGDPYQPHWDAADARRAVRRGQRAYTALAEAEIDYKEKVSTFVFVTLMPDAAAAILSSRMAISALPYLERI